MNQIQEDVNRQAKELGVEIVDLRMTRVDLPAQNSAAVYKRMKTEREREAADIRANGDQIAATIKAKADRDVTVLLAEATRRPRQLRGQGDADKNRILAEAYGKDADFFSFYRSMQAYEAGLKGSDTRLVISPSSDFFRYFSDPQGRAAASRRPPATRADPRIRARPPVRRPGRRADDRVSAPWRRRTPCATMRRAPISDRGPGTIGRRVLEEVDHAPRRERRPGRPSAAPRRIRRSRARALDRPRSWSARPWPPPPCRCRPSPRGRTPWPTSPIRSPTRW